MPDIAPGYTFTSGDTVTHTKLNSAAGGNIDASFYTGKSTLSSYSASNCTVLVYDSGTNSFKRGTLANVVFNSDELIKNRTATTTPPDTYIFLCQDPSGGMFKVTRADIFYQMFSVSGLLDAAGALGFTTGWGLKVLVDGSTLEIASNALRVKDASLELVKLTAAAKRSLAGALGVWSYQTAATTNGETANTVALTPLALNTEETNTLVGASLAANQVTLAAGRYEITLIIRGYTTNSSVAEVYDVAGAGTVLSTVNSQPLYAVSYLGNHDSMQVTGIVDLPIATTIGVRAKAQTANTWGYQNALGITNRYQTLIVRQAY